MSSITSLKTVEIKPLEASPSIVHPSDPTTSHRNVACFWLGASAGREGDGSSGTLWKG